MTRRNLLPIVAVALAFAAAVISFKLTVRHVSGAPTHDWFDVGCGAAEGAGADCDAVLASPYSYWPPKKKNEPPGTPHIPVAFFGLVYYSILLVWLIGVGRPSYERRVLHLLPIGLVACGLTASAYFLLIMFGRLDRWCLWCLITHVLNVMIALALVMMWPRRASAAHGLGGKNLPEEAEFDAPRRLKPAARRVVAMDPAATESTSATRPHPSGRLLLVTAVAVWLTIFGQIQMLGRAYASKNAVAIKRSFDQCTAMIKTLGGDPVDMVRRWRASPQFPLTIRPDDPRRLTRSAETNRAATVRERAEDLDDGGRSGRSKTSEAVMTAVVFSDLQCPSCRRLAAFLETTVVPVFGGRLDVVFKHYPLCRDCNPMTETRKHAHACQAAAMAEAARMIGGSPAFWRVHDYIFDNQARLKTGELTVAEVASHTGLSAHRMRELTRSDRLTARIREDTQLARACGVHATPALFVEGRRVDPLARNDVRFWKQLALELETTDRGEPDAPAGAKNDAATQDTPGRTGAP